MKKTTVLFLNLLIVLLVSSCSFSSDITGNEVRVEWIEEETYHDDIEFRDYTPFYYNGVYYKEIPNCGENENYVLFDDSDYWSIDTSKMRVLGKMKIRSSSSAYVPPEVEFLYQFHQAYAYPQDESEPVFIYCSHHLWTKDDTVVLSPTESTVNQCSLFQKVRERHSLTYSLELVEMIEGPFTIKEMIKSNTQKLVSFNSNMFDPNFDLTSCYQLSFLNSEYPFLYSGLNVAKLRNGKWCWVQYAKKEDGYYMVTELQTKWCFNG